MTSAICTLFEGNYHFGLGALTNSLYKEGFRGVIYSGYRGPLPPWITEGKIHDGFTDFKAAEGLVMRFIPLTTSAHLTNYKPDFMLEVWNNHCPESQSLFYFDPDITVKCRWTFFEEWVHAGVALAADVNPIMPRNHPVRYSWKRFCARHGIELPQELDTYFNGGFIGMHKSQCAFLSQWLRIQELMAPEIGGLQNVNVGEGPRLFHKTDQDALNIACMLTDCPLSPVGQDGMDFQHGGGGYIMSHAIGKVKPWRKSFVGGLVSVGAGPSRADKNYFKHVMFPIRLYRKSQLAWRFFVLKVACALGRFVRPV